MTHILITSASGQQHIEESPDSDEETPWERRERTKRETAEFKEAYLMSLHDVPKESLYIMPPPHQDVTNICEIRHENKLICFDANGKELWKPYLVEEILQASTEIAVELSKVDRNGFQDALMFGVRSAIKKVIQAEYIPALTKQLTQWHESIPRFEDGMLHSCCQETLQLYNDLQRKHGYHPDSYFPDWLNRLNDSLVKAIPLLARWCAMSYTHDPLIWSDTLSTVNLEQADKKIAQANAIPDNEIVLPVQEKTDEEAKKKPKYKPTFRGATQPTASSPTQPAVSQPETKSQPALSEKISSGKYKPKFRPASTVVGASPAAKPKFKPTYKPAKPIPRPIPRTNQIRTTDAS